MKTLKVLATAAIATTMLSVGAVSASAADSTGDVQFTSGTLKVDMDNGGTAMSFGSHSTDEVGNVFQVVGANESHSFTVTDNRGNDKGWQLQVARTEFKNGDGNELTASELKFTNIAHSSPTNTVAESLVTPATPVTITNAVISIMGAHAGEGTGTHIGTFTGTEGSFTDTTLNTAVTTNDSITLQIPTTTPVYTTSPYEADLTWTMLDAPLT